MKTLALNERVAGVKVRYEDGSVRRLDATELAGWHALPRFGVQVVSIYDTHTINAANDHGAAHFASYDYYWYEPGVGFGETNRPDEIPRGAWVLRGSEMDKDAFRALYNAALADGEWSARGAIN